MYECRIRWYTQAEYEHVLCRGRDPPQEEDTPGA
jgi:hypothetical protein